MGIEPIRAVLPSRKTSAFAQWRIPSVINVNEHLTAAVALDPAFAAAWSEIARVRVRQYYLGQITLAAARAEAHRAIGKALQLNPQLPEAHLARGRVLYFLDWDWQGADTEMKTSLRLGMPPLPLPNWRRRRRLTPRLKSRGSMPCSASEAFGDL